LVINGHTLRTERYCNCKCLFKSHALYWCDAHTGGILVAWLISRNITKPLHKLINAATEIAEGDYEVQVEVDRTDELGALAKSI